LFEHVGWHVGAAHVLPRHIDVALVHATPHAPQLCGSLFTFTHAPPQHTRPAEQVLPPLQDPPPLSPVVPSFAASEPELESVPPSRSPTVEPPQARRTVHSASKERMDER
jgi:hypothetical protein